jgi:hypothetical protein
MRGEGDVSLIRSSSSSNSSHNSDSSKRPRTPPRACITTYGRPGSTLAAADVLYQQQMLQSLGPSDAAAADVAAYVHVSWQLRGAWQCLCGLPVVHELISTVHCA